MSSISVVALVQDPILARKIGRERVRLDVMTPVTTTSLLRDIVAATGLRDDEFSVIVGNKRLTHETSTEPVDENTVHAMFIKKPPEFAAGAAAHKLAEERFKLERLEADIVDARRRLAELEAMAARARLRIAELVGGVSLGGRGARHNASRGLYFLLHSRNRSRSRSRRSRRH
jgi:hypothetical protein